MSNSSGTLKGRLLKFPDGSLRQHANCSNNQPILVRAFSDGDFDFFRFPVRVSSVVLLTWKDTRTSMSPRILLSGGLCGFPCRCTHLERERQCNCEFAETLKDQCSAKCMWHQLSMTDGETDNGQNDPYFPLCFAGTTINLVRIY